MVLWFIHVISPACAFNPYTLNHHKILRCPRNYYCAIDAPSLSLNAIHDWLSYNICQIITYTALLDDTWLDAGELNQLASQVYCFDFFWDIPIWVPKKRKDFSFCLEEHIFSCIFQGWRIICISVDMISIRSWRFMLFLWQRQGSDRVWEKDTG